MNNYKKLKFEEKEMIFENIWQEYSKNNNNKR